MGDQEPRRVGRYSLGERMPSGAGRSVHRARDPAGRELVLKRHETGEAEAHGRAELELLGLEHAGLAVCVDAFRTPGDRRLTTVTEWVDGSPLGPGTLGPSSGRDPVLAAARLLAAVAVLHRAGIVHRDIKDDNVLLEATGSRPVLIDFGLACRIEDAPTLPLAGTPRSLAPELLVGGRGGIASDLWGVGLVLVEALLGRRLFEGDDDAVTQLESRRSGLGPASAELSWVAPALVALLDRLLRPDPADRPEDATSAMASLPLPAGAAAELYAEVSRAQRTAAVGATDARRRLAVRTLVAGAVHLDPFPGGATDPGAVLADLSGWAEPGSAWASRLAVDRERATLAPSALARAIAGAGSLVVGLGPSDAEDAWGRHYREDLAAALGRLGVEVVVYPPPDGPTARSVLSRWIGDRPVLARRLEATPPPGWSALAAALAALEAAGVVRCDAAGVHVDESRLPVDWPAPAPPPPPDLPDPAARLFDVSCLCPRPLTVSQLAAAHGADPAPALHELLSRGLLVRRRGRPEDLFEPADALWRRRPLDVPTPVRRRLADALGPGRDGDPATAGAVDEDLAAAIVGVLEGRPEGEDPPRTTALVEAAADVLRRAGRLSLAAVALDRALAGAPSGAAAVRLHIARVDVAIRRMALDAAEAALEEARGAGVAGGVLCVREARIAALRGDVQGALARLESFDPDAVPPDDAVLGLQQRGELLRRAGRPDEAHRDLREALRRQGDRVHRRTMTLLERLGSVASARGRWDEALQSFDRSAAMARELGFSSLVWSPMYNSGRVLRARGEVRRGLRLQEEAAVLCEQAGEVTGLASVLNGLGAGWMDVGRVDRARRHLGRALELAREVDDRALVATVLNNTARALAAEGRHEEAEERFAESLALRAALGDRRGQAAVALTRGAVRLDRGLVEGAAEDLAAAREALVGLDVPEWSLAADRLEARLGLITGDRGAARAAARRAEASAGALGRTREVLWAREILARLGEVDLEDVAPNGHEASAALAAVLFARAEARAAAGRHDLADEDADQALSVLGEAPDAAVEARGLTVRIGSGLDRVGAALAGETPDVAALGTLLSRVTRDLDRARTLVSQHDVRPLARPVEELAARLSSMSTEEHGLDLAGLAERVSNLERLLEVNKLLTSERDTQRLLELIVDSAIELTGAARGFLILFDGQAEEFRAARNIDESTIRDPQFQISHSVARRVVRTAEPLLTANAIDDSRLGGAASISELKLLSILCVPLVSHGRSLGAAYLDHPRVVGRFREEHLAMVTALAEQAAIALENARLSEGLERSNRELREREREVARLNEALRKRLDEQEAELEQARESLDASRRALALRYDYSQIVTASPRMLEVLDLLDRITDTDFPVVIYGESGTGKELIARALHFNGPRRERNFLSINCAAIAEPLIESELFGSVRGAFTGADRDRKGLFAQADGGTLFLDEIGDMSLDVQKRLLRVLQEGEFIPVGGREVQRVDVRILCATHRQLSDRVREASFREDLYYRLAVARVELPPLRERTEDIALLLLHFLEEQGGHGRRIDPDALALLTAQPWPGNVRELRNLAMNVVLFDREGTRVTAELVRRVLGLADDVPAPADASAEDAASLKARMEAFERRQVEEALARSGGNKARAARSLGVPIRTFYKMLARLGL